jgi:Immunity protein 53
MTKKITASDTFSLLQAWYLSQCDGDWEHSYGVKIETLDNPGWIVTIDLNETVLYELEIPLARVDRSASDWVQHEVSNGKFTACGGPQNLEELVGEFLKLTSS